MTKRAELFGIDDGELDGTRKQVEKILELSLEAHESEYHGGDYFKLSGADFNIVLQTNFIEDDGEPTEAEFPGVAILLYVNGERNCVDRMRAVLCQNGLKLLRSSTF
jgi:hypothetical protein